MFQPQKNTLTPEVTIINTQILFKRNIEKDKKHNAFLIY